MGNKQSTTTPKLSETIGLTTPSPNNNDIRSQNLEFEEVQERRAFFLKYGVKLFLDAYDISISNYFHPSSYIEDFARGSSETLLETAVEGTSEVLTATIPIVGFLLGKSLKLGAEIYERRRHEKNGEKMAIIFEGYHSNREKFIDLLKLVFDRIFIHCNIQFGDILIKPSRSNKIELEKLILNIAQDIVMRMFHYLEEKANPEIPENIEHFLCEAFVIGNSEDSKLSKILTENFSIYFSKCIVPTIYGEMTISQVLDKADICFHTTVVLRNQEEKPSQFLYRRAFKHESKHDSELRILKSCKKEDYQMLSGISDHFSDLKEEDVIPLADTHDEQDHKVHEDEEMLQAISKYLRCESQILKDMLKQEHDQIDDVKDVINHNVSDAKDEIIAELENTKKEVLDCIKDIKDEEMLQAISKYLRCESQILKEMLKQEHDQIDDVEDVINHNVSDAKDEIIAELENTKKEVLDCIKIELKEHMNQLFESFQGKINQNIKEEIVKRKNDTISGRVVKLWSPKGGKK